MPRKTLYIRPQDEAMWAAAARVATDKGVSVSQIVAEALRTDLPRIAAQPAAEEQWASIAARAA